eukprot:CAMPEP_0194374222 /NCGR_PEP_ID=MMETSP0174-20130528/22615_1 /TAXON_ID=216777 /ORGANISM="Proboscia alata, Strain PI-D3" /LENGTH=181 /DNA_ID=CAMNT_0039153663 /DNA_START=591 /DNA_END=1136 /DNA_ORIENTATION=+
MTTHSHTCGLLNETVLAYEVDLTDSLVVQVTKAAYPDFFHALSWSHGTLGLLVSLELRIVPPRPSARVEYFPFTNQRDFIEYYNRAVQSERSNQEKEEEEKEKSFFLETIVFRKEEAVVMKGYLSDGNEEGVNVNTIGRYYKPWFFKHVESILCTNHNSSSTSKAARVELIPIYDYIMRND